MRVLAVCADAGIPLEGTKGASVHVRAIWTALARSGCAVEGFAAWRGGTLPDEVPGLVLHPVAARGAALPLAIGEQAARSRADVVFERAALGSDVGLSLAAARDVPLVVEVNAPLDDEAHRWREPPEAAAMAALDRTLQGADLVVVVSEALVPWALAHGAREVRVLPNGADVQAFAGPRTASPDGTITIAFCGSFKPWHGLDTLVEAFTAACARAPELRLLLIGEGPGLDEMMRAFRDRGVDAYVTATRAVPHAQIPARLRGADIAVAPAPAAPEAHYVSPLKLVEYAAAGCAIVATTSGQAGTRFVHAVDALLVPPGDAAAMADAFVRLAADRALRERLGAAARARAPEFDWSATAARLVSWIDACRATRRPTHAAPGRASAGHPIA